MSDPKHILDPETEIIKFFVDEKDSFEALRNNPNLTGLRLLVDKFCRHMGRESQEDLAEVFSIVVAMLLSIDDPETDFAEAFGLKNCLTS